MKLAMRPLLSVVVADSLLTVREEGGVGSWVSSCFWFLVQFVAIWIDS